MKKTVAALLAAALLLTAPALPAAAANGPTETAAQDAGAIIGENSAKACALMDVNTGTLIAAMNGREQLYPASVTKVMTLLLVCEAIEEGKLTLQTPLTCSETAAAKGGSQIWLEPGEEMTVDDLLKATAVGSANDACTLLGEAVAGSEAAFVEQMNERAEALGMTDTHFDNCSGLDDDTQTHKTTACDIALMSRALLGHELIRNYTTVWMDDLRGGATQLVNTNKLIRSYPGATGLKTGTTGKAGCCVAASAQRDGMELIAGVLGAANSKERFAAARALLDWGFANYEIYTPENDASLLGEVTVRHGLRRSFTPVCEEGTDILVRKGIAAQITRTAECPQEIEAPVAAGQAVGRIVFRAGEETVAENAVVCPEEIPAIDWLHAWGLFFRVFSRRVE